MTSVPPPVMNFRHGGSGTGVVAWGRLPGAGAGDAPTPTRPRPVSLSTSRVMLPRGPKLPRLVHCCSSLVAPVTQGPDLRGSTNIERGRSFTTWEGVMKRKD